MHFSRMRTARSSSRPGGGPDPLHFPLGCWPGPDPPQFPSLDVGLDLIPLNFPLGCGPGSDLPQFPLGCGPGSDPPQFPPWVWAWRHPPDQIPPLSKHPPSPSRHPPGAGTPACEQNDKQVQKYYLAPNFVRGR